MDLIDKYQNKNGKIEVTYDGRWPNTCRGSLHIIVGGKEIYVTEPGSFSSTGSVSFTKDWEANIEEGELVWSPERKAKFKTFLKTLNRDIADIINEKIEEELEKIHVCCGGCV